MIPMEYFASYSTTPNAELARRFGVSEVTIKKWAWKHGLKKSPEYRAKVQRENATGRVMSAESRAKVAAKARGRKWTTEQREKAKGRPVLRGPQHPNWKGGHPWERFRDPLYLRWRYAVLARDGYICQDCGRKCGKREKGLAAHHLKPYAAHPELRYDVENGITLCRLCHMTRHGRRPREKPPVPCECGCGTLIPPVDRYGRPRRFVNHHGRRKRN